MEELKKTLSNLCLRYGYDFTGYAEGSLTRRTVNFMNLHKIDSITHLEERLLADAGLFGQFVRSISVTVTEMFRDPLFYRVLRKDVLTRLATYPYIRVWVAGCATGEEAYSVAILLEEEKLLSRTVIYATDINSNSLELAREGVFSLDYMKQYTINYQRAGGKRSFSEYYLANYNFALLHKRLKKNIVFAGHNLATDHSFNEFHLILCRNVLIYFTPPLQNRVVNLFYDSLCPFGFLGLGNKESILFTDKKDSFQVVDKKQKLFMKVQ